jgi:hypothetical protein
MKKYILTTLSAALLFASCDTVDFGNTNQNINGPSKIDPAGLMTGAILDYSNNSGRIYLTNPTLYVQYQTQNVYLDETRYSDVAQDWSEYYVKAFGNLNVLISFLNVPENVTPTVLSQGSLNNQLGVAKIMKAIVTKRITDLYGDIPYTEAGKGLEFLNPKYDKQEFIYKSLIAELKAGRDLLKTSETKPKGDVLYNGDVAKWKKLANSTLLQATLQLSKRYPTASGFAAVEFNSALNNVGGLITTVADEPWFKYITADGVSNPYFASRPADYDVTRQFAQSLKGSGTLNRTSNHTFDPRVSLYMRNPTSTSATNLGTGKPYGQAGGSVGSNSRMNLTLNAQDSPLPMTMAAYTFLNRAEAAAKGWTTENAATLLKSGIVISFETLYRHYRFNIATPTMTQAQFDTAMLAANAYADARVVDAATEGVLKVIAEEKWVALFLAPFDSWSEWRRTRVPTLVAPAGTFNGGVIPNRYKYPDNEVKFNTANYNIGVQGLTPAEDSNKSKIWWDL